MKMIESKLASTFLFSLLIFLTLFPIEARKNRAPCSSSSSCGDIQNISYPFRLKNDPSNCGDPDYELSCINNKTILEIFPGKFYVKNISYSDQILRLVDVNFAGANANCSLPSGSVETTDGFVEDIRFKGYVAKFGSRFRFVKCSRNVTGLPEAANYTSVPCLTRNGTYIYTSYDGEYSYLYSPTSCSVVSWAPVDLRYKLNFKFPSYGAVMELLQAGFAVGWSVQCRDCILSGKQCFVQSSDTKPVTYKCKKANQEPTPTQAYLVLAGIVVGAVIGLVVVIVILVVGIRKYRGRRNAAANKEKNVQSQNYSAL